METITVTLSLPKFVFAVAGVREQELGTLLRETVAVEPAPRVELYAARWDVPLYRPA